MSRTWNHVVRTVALACLCLTLGQSRLAQGAVVASYDFNETSGASALDISGNSRTATIAGGVTLGVAGNPYLSVGNKAFQFDGVNDTVTRSGDSAFGPGTFVANSGWTLETWVKVAPGNTYANGFITWYLQSGNTPTYQLMLDGSGHARGWTRNNAGVSHGFLTSVTDLRDNNWHHLAFVFGHNGANTGYRALYVDGALSASDTPASLGTISGTTALTMGWFDGYPPSDDRFFNGTIDLVRVYNNALTASQILANFQLGEAPALPPVPEPSTIALLGCAALVFATRRQRNAR